jgi:hypothetical protein
LPFFEKNIKIQPVIVGAFTTQKFKSPTGTIIGGKSGNPGKWKGVSEK